MGWLNRINNLRTFAFFYTTLVLLALVATGAWFVASNRTSGLFGDENIREGLCAVWFAMLGGVAISYKGVFDHRSAREWANGWTLWYVGRPFACFIVGVVTLGLLLVVNTKSLPSIPALAIAAFTLGTQDKRFFAFLYEVAKLVLTTPVNAQDSFQITSLNPEHGQGNSILIVEGTGFQQGAVTTVGGTPMPCTVSLDGTAVAGLVPAGTVGAKVDVTVMNPDNTGRRSSKQFTYTT